MCYSKCFLMIIPERWKVQQRHALIGKGKYRCIYWYYYHAKIECPKWRGNATNGMCECESKEVSTRMTMNVMISGKIRSGVGIFAETGNGRGINEVQGLFRDWFEMMNGWMTMGRDRFLCKARFCVYRISKARRRNGKKMWAILKKGRSARGRTTRRWVQE